MYTKFINIITISKSRKIKIKKKKANASNVTNSGTMPIDAGIRSQESRYTTAASKM